MRMGKEILKCPVCKDQVEASECTFVTKIKTDNGKEMLCCCPTQAKKVKNE
jgi:hypothetical protein